MKPETLLTERLLLRRANESDAEILFNQYFSDIESSRFLARKPYTELIQVQKFLKEWCDNPWDSDQKKFAWIIAQANSNKSIGIFLVELEDDHSAQIHYGVSPEFARKGFITEAGRAVVKWLSVKEEINKIWALCDLQNEGSKRVLEKLGFLNEVIHNNRLILPAFGEKPRDCYHFTLNKQVR